MLTKLRKGEYSLAASFWKFGILGLLVGYVVLYIIERILNYYLGGMSLMRFYMGHFSLLNINSTIVVFTILHAISLVLYLIYSGIVFLGVWRSAHEYNKSSWLKWLARIFIMMAIAVGLNCAF